MGDKYRPALTPEQWAARRTEHMRLDGCTLVATGTGPDGAPVEIRLDPDELPGLITLVFAAMPVASTRRSTWADVELLAGEAARRGLEALDDERQGMSSKLPRAKQAQLRRLALNLANALPPDPAAVARVAVYLPEFDVQQPAS